MYLQHFGFRELPFSLTPNTQFFLYMASHHKAYNMVMVSLANAEGFIKVVGEVGTGKTMLAEEIAASLGMALFVHNNHDDETALRVSTPASRTGLFGKFGHWFKEHI